MHDTTDLHHVDFGKFFLAISAQLVVTLGLYWLLFPVQFQQEAAQPGAVVLVALAFGVPLSLFEYLYHRYLLHSSILPFLSAMHRAHTKHHSLTSVKAPVSAKEPERLVDVKSTYPIVEEHQEESMMFPLWSYPIFIGVFLVLLALPTKLLWPGLPVFLPLVAAVTLYYCAYEVWHALLHLPFERFWKPLMEVRPTKRLVQHMYGFHLMHHWRPTTNLAIVGLWGVALWDHLFRTHRRPERLPLDGSQVAYVDARIAQPLWPIAALDRAQAGLYKRSRQFERFLARLFLRSAR